MKKIFFIALILLIFPNLSLAAVIFEDNFDSDANWTVTQPVTETLNCYTNCGTPGEWEIYRNGKPLCTSSVANRPGYNNFYINSATGYPFNASGGCFSGSKCLTHWQESCTDVYDNSDGNLGLDLEQEYSEIFLRFKIKFQPNFQRRALTGIPPTDGFNFKLFHMQHYDPINYIDPFVYHNQAPYNEPVAVASLNQWSTNININWVPRCNTSYWCVGETLYVLGSITWAYAAGGIFDGNWHTLEFRWVKNSSPGVADGYVRVYYDGNLLAPHPDHNNQSGIAFNEASAEDRGIRFVSILGNAYNYWNTSCTDMANGACEQWYAVDDVVISTTYVGSDYVVGGSAPTDTTPPAINITSPTNASTYSISASSVNLGGTASDNLGVNSVSYNNASGGNGVCVGTNSWTCSNIALSVGNNFITVTAQDATGNIGTDLITVTYAPSDSIPPSNPSNLSAAAISSSQINLSWTASTDNIGVSGYRIFRNGSLVATSATNSYQDSGLTASTNYSYYVMAYDASGNVSGQSNSASATTQAGAPPGSGLVVAYSFNQSAGTSLADDSGNGYTGTLVNDPAWIAGQYGNALRFDGSNDYVGLSTIVLPGTFTLSLWYSDYSSALGHLVSGNIQYGPKLYDNGNNFFFRAVSSEDASVPKGAQNTWHYVAVTRDSNGKVDMYIDSNSPARLFGDVAQIGNFSFARIGSNEANVDNWYGVIDNLRLYNRSLSSSEILTDRTTAIGASSDTTPPAAPSGVIIN